MPLGFTFSQLTGQQGQVDTPAGAVAALCQGTPPWCLCAAHHKETPQTLMHLEIRVPNNHEYHGITEV